MEEVQWIKLYIDMFGKPKINKIRRLPAGDSILLFWVMLLATAGKCNAGGMIFITERVPFTKEDLADEFDIEISTIELALNAFVEYDMIDLYDDGFISVRNWEKYQNTDRLAEIREQNRERKRLQRAKKKQSILDDVSRDSHVTVTQDVTGCHAIEEEKEEDKEKEIHSFVLSSASEDEMYLQKKVNESGLEGLEAEIYKAEVKAGLKQKYLGGSLGQGVLFMSDEQFSDLCDKLTYDELNKYCDIVTECEKSGKKYKKKSHYQAILDMVNKDRRIR
jgi:predicted phage replisome organizer